VSDETPPGRNGKQSLPEADLDAALWPDPSASPSRMPEAQPISMAPKRRPVKAAVPADNAQRPDPTALITRSPAGPQEREGRAESRDGLADTVPLTPAVSRSATNRSATNKAPRESARDRLRREREREARRRRRTRWSVVGAAVLVLIAGAVASIVILRHDHTPRKVDLGYAGPYAPVTLNVDNSVTMAQPGVTSPVIDVYEDFQCSECRAFENTNGGMLQQLAHRGKVKVVYYPFTIFSDQPEQANSVRAWAAARCAPPSRWAKYHNALYANQPAETAVDGFSVGMLVRLGKEVGITSPAFVHCVRSQEYAVQDAPLSDQIMNGGVSGMPTLTLNGHVLHISPTSRGLRKLILAQGEGGRTLRVATRMAVNWRHEVD
jgi:protein-disulfide isomerase